MKRRACIQWLTAACGGPLAVAAEAQSKASPRSLSVLHWWTSEGERRAADALAEVLARHGVRWRDVAVAGGAGSAAIKVLNSRMLMGDPPEMAQLIGSNLINWANAGLVAPLAPAGSSAPWLSALFPSVRAHITHHDQAIAVPLGIHRINNLYVHREIFQRFGLRPPRNWSELFQVAESLKRHGIEPLAWSDQPWQIATVFETMLAGDVGAGAYRAMVVQRQSDPWLHATVGRCLKRMVQLREQASTQARERAWNEAAKSLFEGQAAMMIMGDWVSGEMRAWDNEWEQRFDVLTTPNTHDMHVYSIDSLAMLKQADATARSPIAVADLLTAPDAQYAYNNAKGSAPVRHDIDPQRLTPSAQRSWRDFAATPHHRLPSLAHRMAATESIKDAVAKLVWQFTNGIQTNTALTQRRLAAAVRAPDPLKHKD